MQKLFRCTILAGFIGLYSPVAARGQSDIPEVSLSLHASVEAVAAARPFEVGLEFKLPEGYHIYWENPGDSGMAPQVKWTLPEGWKVGRVRFPAPKRHEEAGLVTYILEDTPVLLATVLPPEGLQPGKTAEIKADVSYLYCKERCYRGKGDASVQVRTAKEEQPLTNEDEQFFFRLARKAMPLPAGESKLAELDAGVTQSSVERGGEFEVTLDVSLKKGFHAQSNKPLGEFFIPTSVFVRTVEGLTFGQPIWPEAHVRTNPVLGKISEFEGDFQVRVPVKLEAPTATPNVTISGLLKYQACNEQGQCRPPEAIEWSVPITSTWFQQETAAAEEGIDEQLASGELNVSPGESESAEGAAAKEDGSFKYVSQSEGGLGGFLSRAGLLGAIIGGFLGGLILNIMPCVLPVISIKILSFVQQANEEPRRVFHLGLTFAAGIIVSFLVLAVGILVLQEVSGSVRGWGTFFQEPAFVLSMIVVMFVFALNLFGVFEIILPGAASGKLAAATEREGFSGAFMKGVLATLLATPCTAPFLASAISFALAGSTLVVLVIFTSAGVGMAIPYVLLTAKPAWMKYMPKPGNWMVTFKQFMGFLLIGTAVWLLWVLGALTGASGVVWTVAFLAFLGLACWLYGRVEYRWSSGKKFVTYAASLGIILFGGWYAYGMYVPPEDAPRATGEDVQSVVKAASWTEQGVPWVAYRQGLARALAEMGYTVYVDYTATWCFTCQVNKKLVFSNDAVLREMKQSDVIPIKADFTRYDARIADDLKRFNRDAVPLNVIYPANKPDEPIVLPVVLTPGTVLEALQQAGPSLPADKLAAKSPPGA